MALVFRFAKLQIHFLGRGAHRREILLDGHALVELLHERLLFLRERRARRLRLPRELLFATQQVLALRLYARKRGARGFFRASPRLDLDRDALGELAMLLSVRPRGVQLLLQPGALLLES